jgi:hypothetical protein
MAVIVCIMIVTFPSGFEVCWYGTDAVPDCCEVCGTTEEVEPKNPPPLGVEVVEEPKVIPVEGCILEPNADEVFDIRGVEAVEDRDPKPVEVEVDPNRPPGLVDVEVPNMEGVVEAEPKAGVGLDVMVDPKPPKAVEEPVVDMVLDPNAPPPPPLGAPNKDPPDGVDEGAPNIPPPPVLVVDVCGTPNGFTGLVEVAAFVLVPKSPGVGCPCVDPKPKLGCWVDVADPNPPKPPAPGVTEELPRFEEPKPPPNPVDVDDTDVPKGPVDAAGWPNAEGAVLACPPPNGDILGAIDWDPNGLVDPNMVSSQCNMERYQEEPVLQYSARVTRKETCHEM